MFNCGTTRGFEALNGGGLPDDEQATCLHDPYDVLNEAWNKIACPN